MNRLVLTLGAVALLSTASLFLGSNRAGAAALGSGGPPLGENCTVQFRRDALGSAANLPVSPLTGSINGAETCVIGKLRSFSGEWVVVERAADTLWIPKAVVLLVQAGAK